MNHSIEYIFKTPFSPPASRCFPNDLMSHNGLPVMAVPTQAFVRRSQALMVLSKEQLKKILGSLWCGSTPETPCLWP